MTRRQRDEAGMVQPHMNPVELLEGLKRTVDQLAAFNDIAKALTSTLELEAVLDVVGARLSTLLQAQRWSLLLERDDGLLHFEVVRGQGADALLEEVLAPGEGIAGAVFTTGKARLVPDAKDDPDFARRFDALTELRTGPVLAVPLAVRGRTLGVLELVMGEGQRAFDAEDLRAATTAADFLGIAIDNARNFRRVQELLQVDEATQLFNSRHLHHQLEAEVARCARFARPMSLLFLDLDDFKRVNDTRGHLAGTAALRHAGTLLTSVIRGVDSAYRYGGDEFAVLLVETGVDGSDTVAQRVLTAFRDHPCVLEAGPPVAMTVSVGVASFPDDGISARSLLDAADKAMYRAKTAGKDTVRRVLDRR
jgi:diguanylate cyclase (GGDEF)-like protein